MKNVFRRQPTTRLVARNLVRKRAIDASALIVFEFFEPTRDNPATENAHVWGFF